VFDRAAHHLLRTLEVILVLCLAVMGILVFGNVIMRYVFNSGIAISEELSRLLFVWLIFLGAIAASIQRSHIGFDSLATAAPPKVRKALALFTGTLMLIACLIFIKGGWAQTRINLANAYPVMEISYAWLYAAAVVFGAVLIFPVCNNIWRVLHDRDGALTEDLGDRIEESIAEIRRDEEPRP
jgi:TRAP-type C4-dicarboxylate transport system permease small subunit